MRALRELYIQYMKPFKMKVYYIQTVMVEILWMIMHCHNNDDYNEEVK
jgi:hypothetical protein